VLWLYTCWNKIPTPNTYSSRCGVSHTLNNCQQEWIKCISCSGSHLSFSKSCPRWKTEQEIVTSKHTLSITFPKAYKQIRQKTNISYASVATKTVSSSAVSKDVFPKSQTSRTSNWIIDWLIHKQPPELSLKHNLNQKIKLLPLDHVYIKDKKIQSHLTSSRFEPL